MVTVGYERIRGLREKGQRRATPHRGMRITWDNGTQVHLGRLGETLSYEG